MATGQDFLNIQLLCVQRTQYELTLAVDAAASHALKTNIRELQSALDQLESQLLILCVQRGWDIPELNPIRKLLIKCGFRSRNDADIAEKTIQRYIDATVQMVRVYNSWKPDDKSIQNLFQKVTDYCTVGIRRMLPFL